MIYNYQKSLNVSFVQKFKKQLAFVAAAVFLVPFASMTLTAHAASTVVVSNVNTNGWTPSSLASGTHSFVNAPDSPLPTGALRLTTTSDPNDYIKMQKDFATAIPLSSIINLKYSTKQETAADLINGNASFKINLDLDANGTLDDQVIFEPYYNGFAGGMTWNTWNVLSGKFWSNIAQNEYNGSQNCNGCAGGYESNFTLADVLHDYPSAKVMAISVSMGTYNISQNVLVDNVQLNDTTYNFEKVEPVVLANKDDCKNNGWKTGTLANSEGTFKNQGDCVSYFATNGKNAPAGTSAADTTSTKKNK